MQSAITQKLFYLRNISADDTPLIRRLPILISLPPLARLPICANSIFNLFSGLPQGWGVDSKLMDLGRIWVQNWYLCWLDRVESRTGADKGRGSSPSPPLSSVTTISREKFHNESWELPDKTILTVQTTLKIPKAKRKCILGTVAYFEISGQLFCDDWKINTLTWPDLIGRNTNFPATKWI